MNIRDLEYLVAVGDLLHFGKAAVRCNVSQPTLSGQIKKLEDRLQIKIFERTKRRVILTEVGQEIIKSARNVLSEINVIQDIAKNAHEPFSGTLKLAAFHSLAAYIFPELVQKTNQQLPNLKLILSEGKTEDIIKNLKEATIDAALLALPIHDDFLTSTKLFDDEFFLAVPPDHQLSKCETIGQENLSSHRLMLLEEGHCLRDQALEVCYLHGIDEEQTFKATSMETLRQMVKAGTGITFIPKTVIDPDETGISYIPFKAPVPMRRIGLVWRKTTPKIELLIFISKIFKR